MGICGKSCPRTCQNLDGNQDSNWCKKTWGIILCCYCKDGYFFNEEDNVCVPLATCPSNVKFEINKIGIQIANE